MNMRNRKVKQFGLVSKYEYKRRKSSHSSQKSRRSQTSNMQIQMTSSPSDPTDSNNGDRFPDEGIAMLRPVSMIEDKRHYSVSESLDRNTLSRKSLMPVKTEAFRNLMDDFDQQVEASINRSSNLYEKP